VVGAFRFKMVWAPTVLTPAAGMTVAVMNAGKAEDATLRPTALAVASWVATELAKNTICKLETPARNGLFGPLGGEPAMALAEYGSADFTFLW
jgi:hypothetical protein